MPNENTLVITSSYSGQTEETISALKQALDKNAKIICITTGGQISIIALKEKLDLIKMPLDLQKINLKNCYLIFDQRKLL